MTDDKLRQEFASMAARAGITIAADRDEVMFAAFKSLRELLTVVHKPFAYADEPADVAPGRPA